MVARLAGMSRSSVICYVLSMNSPTSSLIWWERSSSGIRQIASASAIKSLRRLWCGCANRKYHTCSNRVTARVALLLHYLVCKCPCCLLEFAVLARLTLLFARLVIVILFGDVIGWVLDRHAVRAGARTAIRRVLSRLHQIGGNGFDQALNTIPACGIALGVKFLAPLAVIDVEHVVSIRIAVLHARVRDTRQFDDLQGGARLLAAGVGDGALLRGLLHQRDGSAPDIARYSLRRRVGMQRLVHLSVEDQFTAGANQLLMWNTTIANEACLRAQVEAAHDLAVAYQFACAIAVSAEDGFPPLAGCADPFAVATRAIHLAIDAIGARNGLALIGRVGIHRIGHRNALLANIVEDIGDTLTKGRGDIIGLTLEKRLFLALRPVGDIAAPTTGRTAFLGATFAVGTDNPASPGAGRAEGASGAVTGGAGNNLVQSFQACAATRRFETRNGGKLVVPDGQQWLWFTDGTPCIWFRDSIHAARLPPRLHCDLPHLVGCPGNNVHIGAEVFGYAPVLVAPHIGKLPNALFLDAASLARRLRYLNLFPVLTGLIDDALNALLSLACSLYHKLPDLFKALLKLFLIGKIGLI